MHPIGFTVEIYFDAQPDERQIYQKQLALMYRAFGKRRQSAWRLNAVCFNYRHVERLSKK